jgi:hypothetical protein
VPLEVVKPRLLTVVPPVTTSDPKVALPEVLRLPTTALLVINDGQDSGPAIEQEEFTVKDPRVAAPLVVKEPNTAPDVVVRLGILTGVEMMREPEAYVNTEPLEVVKPRLLTVDSPATTSDPKVALPEVLRLPTTALLVIKDGQDSGPVIEQEEFTVKDPMVAAPLVVKEPNTAPDVVVRLGILTGVETMREPDE